MATAVMGTGLAIGATTTMDAIGQSNFNSLPLIPLFFVFWYLTRLSRAEIGMAWGRPGDYALAVFYPVVVVGLIGLIAYLSGAVSTAHTDWSHVVVQVVTSLIFTVLVAIVTEEGIFRGWLWATLKRAGVSTNVVLAVTSLAFAAWHVSTAVLPTGFHPPLIPVYLANAAVIGFTWGLIRLKSGSIVVSSVSHSVYNTLDYVFIGVGTTAGALGIQNLTVFDPEGWVGLGLNVAFAAILYLSLNRRGYIGTQKASEVPV
jgi:membrane protease YdiL (CAAX protease family)